jgi:hypothetical protein
VFVDVCRAATACRKTKARQEGTLEAMKKMCRRAASEGAEQRKEFWKETMSGGFLRMRWKFLTPVLASFSTNKHCRLANFALLCRVTA